MEFNIVRRECAFEKYITNVLIAYEIMGAL